MTVQIGTKAKAEDLLSWGSPVSGHKVHAKHNALLCVLPAVGGDNHHVAGYLRYGALKTHSLPEKVNSTHEAAARTVTKVAESFKTQHGFLNF